MSDSAKLPRAWVRPVNPEDYPGFADRPVKPVTRADLGNQFHTVALRHFQFDHPPDPPPHKYRVVALQETLDLWTKVYDFGRVVWPFWTFLFAENWREVIDELAARRLYLFDIWGYVPSGDQRQTSLAEFRVPDELHKYIVDKLGPLFLGYDSGEQDGRFIGGYAPMVCPAPATRRQGYEAFCQFFRHLNDDMQNYMVALNSLTFSHYFADMGNHRLLGAETAQALPSVPISL